ncbi:Hypothetical predicted protein [Podarcis lilfordi]|uniref:Uncharacterized protein n=1 Tax=Podarcis lilfordi TaxID=74358 RepID=A0AA35NTF8_9SAUR|nr:Hypothetical predicted protein [Podarcis lilfordi]
MAARAGGVRAGSGAGREWLLTLFPSPQSNWTRHLHFFQRRAAAQKDERLQDALLGDNEYLQKLSIFTKCWVEQQVPQLIGQSFFSGLGNTKIENGVEGEVLQVSGFQVYREQE